MNLLVISLCMSLFSGCGENKSNLVEQIQADGELIVLTRNSPTTYFEGPHGQTGLEYELASRFAQFLGVQLHMVVPDSFDLIIPSLTRGEAHLAAAGLTVTPERQQQVRFGPVYQEITQQLVYRLGNDQRPQELHDMQGQTVEVIAGSSHTERLRQLSMDHTYLNWKELREIETEELLYQVWQGKVDYTIADSNEVAINQRFFPELRVAFEISEPEHLAWAFAKNGDDSLYHAAKHFFNKLKDNGELTQLMDRYYGHVEDFDYVGTRTYLRHIEKRLPRYQSLFEQAANDHQMDWRLLAAMGYQESHWNPRAKSPTGVRGIMMLTRTTARQLGIENRLDPENSIRGGAAYLQHIKSKLPQSIVEPDRTWMAMASYNIGYGHLKDAQKITEQRGGDPNRWVDVKENLPLLSQKKWYSKTKYGYARGREPVRYVENIRSYYDQLVRIHMAQPIRQAGASQVANATKQPVL